MTLVRVSVGEAEAARTLGEDTLQRSRRTLGPDHLTTLWAAAALALAQTQVGETEAAGALREDTWQRCRRTLGPDNPITRYLAQVAVND